MMKQFYHTFLLCLILICLTACAPKPIQGLYQTAAEDKILMAGHRYEFLAGSRFQFQFWSDDISGNKIGQGTYHYDKRELTLDYTDYPAEASHYTSYPLEELDNGKTYYQFDVSDSMSGHLIGVSIQLLDAQGTTLAQGVSDVKGKFSTTISKTQTAKQISFSYLGMTPLQVELTDRMSSGFSVVLAEQRQYIPAGTVETFSYKSTNTQLILKDGQYTKKLVRRN